MTTWGSWGKRHSAPSTHTLDFQRRAGAAYRRKDFSSSQAVTERCLNCSVGTSRSRRPISCCCGSLWFLLITSSLMLSSWWVAADPYRYEGYQYRCWYWFQNQVDTSGNGPPVSFFGLVLYVSALCCSGLIQASLQPKVTVPFAPLCFLLSRYVLNIYLFVNLPKEH